MKQLTKEDAKIFNWAGKWREMSLEERATFQMSQNHLCMPVKVFFTALSRSLGRAVSVEEYAFQKEGLVLEIAGVKTSVASDDETREELVRAFGLADAAWQKTFNTMNNFHDSMVGALSAVCDANREASAIRESARASLQAHYTAHKPK